jgi:hypothetical protein
LAGDPGRLSGAEADALAVVPEAAKRYPGPMTTDFSIRQKP